MVVGFALPLLLAGTWHQAVEIHGSIEASLLRADPAHGSAVAAQVARVIAWRVDIVRNIHRGDFLSVLYEPGQPAELVAFEYLGAQVVLEAHRFGPRGRFYSGEGELIEPLMTNPPVPEYRQITEVPQRGRGKRTHQGLDLKAPEGVTVIAPFAGTVTRVNWRRRVNGNCIELRLDDGRLSRFLHLLNVEPSIRSGVRVTEGMTLGRVGSTGRSGAPHLHYEIRDRQGGVLNPLEVHGHKSHRLRNRQAGTFAQQLVQTRRHLRASWPNPTAVELHASALD